MTDRPYTDTDLRALAARLHARAARDTDDRIRPAAKREWSSLDADLIDEACDELVGLLDKTADLSRWSVDLGADGLQPDPRALDAGDRRLRLHFAFAPDTTESDRADLIAQFAAFMTHGLT